MAHLIDLSSTPIPTSISYERGKFGRLFPWLSPCLEESPQSDIYMLQIANTMFNGDEETNHLPAGYTYFGQFIIHDISFDPTSINERHVDPEFLWNFRTPSIDLDSVYGGGPAITPYFYDPDKNFGMTHFLLPEANPIKKGDPSFFDLPRVNTSMKTAIIADPRNDENIIISQIHVAILKLHNNLVDKLSGEPKFTNRFNELFRAAQQLVKWHLQWVVLFDYLPRIIDLRKKDDKERKKDSKSETVETSNLVKEKIKNIIKKKVKNKYYDWRNERFIPLEFSCAAFRFGHSQVRARYQFNRDTSNMGNGVFSLFPDEYIKSKKPFARVHLPSFFPKTEDDVFIPSKVIEPKLSKNLKDLPLNISGLGTSRIDLLTELKKIKGLKEELDKLLSEEDIGKPIEAIIAPLIFHITNQPDLSEFRMFLLNITQKINERNLAERNLIRSLKLKLPCGQSVAKAMGIKPLSINIKDAEGFPPHLKDNTPLWYYILYEAQEEQLGQRLGPVGSRIVAEVIIGLLQGDKTSFLNQDPNWVPKDVNGIEKRDFNMADLLELAGVYEPKVS